MTGKAAAVQGALAAVSLVATYFTWQRQPETAPGEVVVVDATKSTLENIRFEDENAVVDLFRRSDGGEKAVWLRVAEKEKPDPKQPETAADDKQADKTQPTAPAKGDKAAADKVKGAKGAATAGQENQKERQKDQAPAAQNAATASTSPAPAKPKPVRELRGSPESDRLFEKFTPLRSPRAFGVLDANKVKELGLDAAKKKLVVTVRNEKRELVIGQPSQGSGESYLRDTRDGRTYLLPRALLADLQGASHRLIDRRLHAFKMTDVSRLALSAGGKKREFVILGRENPHGYKVAPAKASDKPDEMARNWHDKMLRLMPVEIYGKDEVPQAGAPSPSVRLEYFDGGKQIGFVELAKVDLPPSATPATPPPPSPHGAPVSQAKTEYFARTEHTPGWVRLANDPGVIADAEKLASGSP